MIHDTFRVIRSYTLSDPIFVIWPIVHPILSEQSQLLYGCTFDPSKNVCRIKFQQLKKSIVKIIKLNITSTVDEFTSGFLIFLILWLTSLPSKNILKYWKYTDNILTIHHFVFLNIQKKNIYYIIAIYDCYPLY